MKKRMLFSTFLFLLPFLIAALLPHALPAQEKKSLRIVFVSLSWNNQLPFRIAIAKGFFKDQGLTVAPFTAEDTVRLLDKGFPMIVNMNEALRIPQSIFVTRGEMLQKNPETTKRFLKAVTLGMQFAKQHKKEALQASFAAGLTGDPDVASRSYDLFSSGYAADLAVAQEGHPDHARRRHPRRIGREKIHSRPRHQRPHPQTSATGAAQRRAFETVS